MGIKGADNNLNYSTPMKAQIKAGFQNLNVKNVVDTMKRFNEPPTRPFVSLDGLVKDLKAIGKYIRGLF